MLKVNFKIIIFVILVLWGLSFRLLPHPWNFTPIGAISLFSGFYFRKKYAIFAPILAMFLSDIFLGFYDFKLMISVYGSFCLISLIGILIKKRKNLKTILAGSLSASILFFLITNFAVWKFTNWYPNNLSGLIQCFILGLPFFKNTLMGDLFYTSILFGAYEMVSILAKRKLIFIPSQLLSYIFLKLSLPPVKRKEK